MDPSADHGEDGEVLPCSTSPFSAQLVLLVSDQPGLVGESTGILLQRHKGSTTFDGPHVAKEDGGPGSISYGGRSCGDLCTSGLNTASAVLAQPRLAKKAE